MQPQEQRDEKTVTIATALALFVLILVVGGAAGWALNSAFDVTPGLNTVLTVAVSCVAGAASIDYLIRARHTAGRSTP